MEVNNINGKFVPSCDLASSLPIPSIFGSRRSSSLEVDLSSNRWAIIVSFVQPSSLSTLTRHILSLSLSHAARQSPSMHHRFPFPRQVLTYRTTVGPRWSHLAQRTLGATVLVSINLLIQCWYTVSNCDLYRWGQGRLGHERPIFYFRPLGLRTGKLGLWA